ncbi:MAG TPA: hypothetical protein PLJ91_04545, partial [Thermomonas sp.]|nr:hypothetical protein [Thermomonas sp.]
AGFFAAAFFATFFAAGFLATFFAAFLAAGFFAAFFAAAFLTAMVWLLVNGYSGNAQLQKTPRVSDPRSTAGAPGAPVRIGWRRAMQPRQRRLTFRTH